MSFDPKNIDLDSIDTDKLSAEEYIQLLKLKGKAGKGNYTEERHRWQDFITDEEMEILDAKLLKLSKEEDDEVIQGPEPLPPKVIDVQPLSDYKLHIRFENGELRLMDMKPFMIGVFKQLEEQEFFNQVSVLEGWGGITWPGELALSPGMLRYNSGLIQKDE